MADVRRRARTRESPQVTAPSGMDIPANAPVVDVDRFDAAAFDPSVPLIARGAADAAARRWTDDWIVERFRDELCHVSLDSRPAKASHTRHVPVETYMSALTRPDERGRPSGYLFHSQRDFDGAADLLDDLDVPEPLLRLGTPSLYRFFMGPEGSGTLPHVHTFALNALARGRKRWAIYAGATWPETQDLLAESDAAWDAGSQARDWFEEACPTLRSRGLRLWEFLQEPGDLVYIPAYFIHAVVNLESVLGFTVELQPEELP